MKIIAKCDKCNSSFSVDEKFIGRKAKCSKCGESFIVQAAKEAIEPEKPSESAPVSKEQFAGRGGRRELLFRVRRRTASMPELSKYPPAQRHTMRELRLRFAHSHPSAISKRYAAARSRWKIKSTQAEIP